MPSRNSIPLTEEEKELQLFDLDALYKRPSYAEQKEWLLKNTSYFAGEVSDELSNYETSEDI